MSSESASLSKEMKLIAAIRRLTGVDPNIEPFEARRQRVRSLIFSTGCRGRPINPEDERSPTFASAFEQSYGERL